MAAIAAQVGGSIVGGLIQGKGAKKAAKIQQQTVQQQIAANNANMAKITGLEQPTIDRGNAAGTEYAGLLGLGSGAADSAKALDTFRDSSGYQDLLKTGLGAVDANAYAKGMGDSGATLKALQAKGMALADGSQNEYAGRLSNLIGYGNQAVGNIAGVNTQTTTANNAALQTGADASSNAALAQSAAWSKAIGNLASIGSSMSSSFGGGGGDIGSGYGWSPIGATPSWLGGR